MEPWEDESAVEAFRAGELRAFEDLARSYRSRIQGICFRYAGNRADAEDLVQEVLLRIYRGLEGFRGESSFRTWVYRITVNACLNWVASRKGFDALDAEIPDRRPTIIERLVRAESRDRLRRAISELPDRQRMTVLLRVYEELSHKEIAEVMACPVGTVKANFFFALKNLRKRLAR
ncbi:MAG TPA: sigma-70 family RNA polymerase sigma factor [Vicinamibacteria bacterium]